MWLVVAGKCRAQQRAGERGCASEAGQRGLTARRSGRLPAVPPVAQEAQLVVSQRCN